MKAFSKKTYLTCDFNNDGIISGADIVLPYIETEGLMSLTLALLGLGGMRTAEKWKGVQRNNMKKR